MNSFTHIKILIFGILNFSDVVIEMYINYEIPISQVFKNIIYPYRACVSLQMHGKISKAIEIGI